VIHCNLHGFGKLVFWDGLSPFNGVSSMMRVFAYMLSLPGEPRWSQEHHALTLHFPGCWRPMADWVAALCPVRHFRHTPHTRGAAPIRTGGGGPRVRLL
jgi:hypothetical protein